MRKWLTLLILFNLVTSSAGVAQNSLIDSLKVVVTTAEDDTVKVKNLISLSQNLSRFNPQEAIYFATEARDLAEELNYDDGMANALKYIGMGYYAQGRYLETINYWEQSLAVFESLGDQAGIANTLSNLGVINNDEGDDTKALELFLRSLSISEEIEDTLRIATVLMNIGLVYSKKPETYNKALDYYLKALPLSEQLNDNVAIGTVTVNIGEVYFAMDDDSTALFYFERSLKAFEGTADVPFTLNYIGKAYAKRGDFDKALIIQQEAFELARSYDAKLDMAKSLLGIADTYYLKGLNRPALNAYHEANVLLREIGSKNEIREAYQGLALSYSELSDYQNAFKYQVLLTAMKDTLFYAANQKKLDLIHSNFENEKKQGDNCSPSYFIKWI